MSVKAYQERLIALVKDTVTLLCKNGLEYSQEFCVEGLLGVTLDKNEVFLIPIKELVNDKGVGTTDDVVDASQEADGGMSPKRERKKKRRHVESTITQDDSSNQYEHHSKRDWYEDNMERTTDQDNNLNDADNQQPSFKQRRRDDNRSDLARVKAEDIVVIKEEVDDQEFASAFHDSSLDSSSMNRTDQGDSGMAFFSQPGTSQDAMSFSMEQLAGNPGLSGAISGMPPGTEGESEWLQQEDGQNQSADWQGQKHQVICRLCGKVFAYQYTLNRHIRSMHQNTHFRCEVCGKSFSYLDNLKRHAKKLHGCTVSKQ